MEITGSIPQNAFKLWHPRMAYWSNFWKGSELATSWFRKRLLLLLSESENQMLRGYPGTSHSGKLLPTLSLQEGCEGIVTRAQGALGLWMRSYQERALVNVYGEYTTARGTASKQGRVRKERAWLSSILPLNSQS